MARIKEAIIETGEPTAMRDFGQLAVAIRDSYFAGEEDLVATVVARLVEDGVPAAKIAEGTRERALVTQIAQGLNTALLSFGALKSAMAAQLPTNEQQAVVA